MTQALVQGSEAWHQARANRLTGSNFAAAMGINPYQSRQKLYDELTGAVPAFVGNDMTDCGTKHKPGAVNDYGVNAGEFVQPTGFHTSCEHDWLGVSPDGLVGETGLIECKCKFSQELWDCVPDHYMAQVQGQLEITGRDWCDFVSWVPDDISVFRVYRSEDYWAEEFKLLQEFWECLINLERPKRRKKPVLPTVKVERLK